MGSSPAKFHHPPAAESPCTRHPAAFRSPVQTLDLDSTKSRYNTSRALRTRCLLQQTRPYGARRTKRTSKVSTSSFLPRLSNRTHQVLDRPGREIDAQTSTKSVVREALRHVCALS